MVEGTQLSTRHETCINPDVEAYLQCGLIPENAKAVSATFERRPGGPEPSTIVFTPANYETNTKGATAPTPPVARTEVQPAPNPPVADNTKQRVIGDGTTAPPTQVATVDRGVSTQDLIKAGKQEPAHLKAVRSSFYISQEKDAPSGKDWFACGPTSFLNALADWGVMAPTEANRQQLINEVIPQSGGKSTRSAGQFPGVPKQMAEWARQHGLQAEDHTSDTNIADLDRALQEGKGVILNAPNHFVYIIGRDSQGGYVVADPADPKTTTWDRNKVNANLTGGNKYGFAAVWKGDLKGPREVTA